jgi:hypothetical protein
MIVGSKICVFIRMLQGAKFCMDFDEKCVLFCEIQINSVVNAWTSEVEATSVTEFCQHGTPSISSTDLQYIYSRLVTAIVRMLTAVVTMLLL